MKTTYDDDWFLGLVMAKKLCPKTNLINVKFRPYCPDGTANGIGDRGKINMVREDICHRHCPELSNHQAQTFILHRLIDSTFTLY